MVAMAGNALAELGDVGNRRARRWRFMTLGASAFAHKRKIGLVVLLEPLVLGTGTKEAGLPTVAVAADKGDGGQLRWRRAVIAVTVVAGRSGQVILFEHRSRMHAPP